MLSDLLCYITFLPSASDEHTVGLVRWWSNILNDTRTENWLISMITLVPSYIKDTFIKSKTLDQTDDSSIEYRGKKLFGSVR